MASKIKKRNVIILSFLHRSCLGDLIVLPLADMGTKYWRWK